MDPFGTTRSRVRRDHALIAPDSFVRPRSAGLARRRGGDPDRAPDGGAVRPVPRPDGPGGPPRRRPPGVERVLYVLEGEVDGRAARACPHALGPGGFAYLPPGRPTARSGADGRAGSTCSRSGTSRCRASTRPRPVVGHERDVAGEPFLGDPDALLQVLLPDEPAFDLAVNVFTYRPGATLPMVEVHVMEHGLLMLEGQGVYRLGDLVSRSAQGDAIWMAPVLPAVVRGDGQGPGALPLLQGREPRPAGAEDGMTASRPRWTSTGVDGRAGRPGPRGATAEPPAVTRVVYTEHGPRGPRLRQGALRRGRAGRPRGRRSATPSPAGRARGPTCRPSRPARTSTRSRTPAGSTARSASSARSRRSGP